MNHAQAVEERRLRRTDCPGNGSPAVPNMAYLELTHACTNRCPGCLNESFIADFASREVKHEFMQPLLSYRSWLSVLTRLPESIESIILSGGEPTLHPAFSQIVEELDRRGLHFVLFTNGRWHAPAQLIHLLRQSCGFQGALISLHGATAASHDSFTAIPGSFAQAKLNIQLAAASSLPFTISCVITQHNLHELSDIVELAVELGAEEISFNRYLLSPDRHIPRHSLIEPPSAQQLKKAVIEIQSLRPLWAPHIAIGYGPCIPQCLVRSSSHGCTAGFGTFVVDPWGNIRPCLHTDLLTGNLLHTDFAALWQSEAIKKWRRLYDTHCDTCAAFALCGGGCRAMSLATNLGRDPLMMVENIPLLL